MESPFDRFAARRRARDEERQTLAKRLAALNAEAEKDAIAVEQLKLIYPEGWPSDSDAAVSDVIEPAPPPPKTAAQLQARGGGMTVKDMALAVLRDAGPSGLTASQIKGKVFLRYKKHINSNTLTVSLVRLKPEVKCEGRIWHYVRVNGEAAKGNAEFALNHGGAE